MFKINTLIAAYQFARQMHKSPNGKDLYKRFYGLSESLSEKSWSFYKDVIQTCKFSHYYSFGIAYKKIEGYQSGNGSAYLKDVSKELRNNHNLHSFIDDCDKLAQNLEMSYLDLNGNLPMFDNVGILNSFELYRTWLDLFYYLHNTKIFYYLHSKIGKEKLKEKSIQKFLEQREVYPFSSRNRRLLRRLGRSKHNQHDMCFLEFFESTRKNVPQLIFETHFGFQLEIKKEETTTYRENEIDKIRAYKIQKSGLCGLTKGNFLILYEGDEVQDIGIVKRKTVINILENENALSTLSGILYPKTDQELFFCDVLQN
ncbi:hypothetical protein ACTWQB_14410 [Piscibacillus sp. B03]